MFDGLTDRFGEIFDRLKKRGALSEADVTAAMREIRVALLEADVALPVVKDFIDGVRERAVGEEVMRSVTPGQQVVKIVNDYLTEMLGPESGEFEIRAAAPAAVISKMTASKKTPHSLFMPTGLLHKKLEAWVGP